jgi:hypothetical protein
MNLAYRTYRIFPTLIVIVLFLLAGSLLVGRFQSKPAVMGPEDEVRAVYFAVQYATPAPPDVDTAALRQMLGLLDPDLVPIADKITVVSYARSQYGVEMQVRHSGQPDRTFTLNNYGVR